MPDVTLGGDRTPQRSGHAQPQPQKTRMVGKAIKGAARKERRRRRRSRSVGRAVERAGRPQTVQEALARADLFGVDIFDIEHLDEDKGLFEDIAEELPGVRIAESLTGGDLAGAPEGLLESKKIVFRKGVPTLVDRDDYEAAERKVRRERERNPLTPAATIEQNFGLATTGKPFQSALQATEAFKEDPGGTAKGTLGQAKGALLGLGQAIGEFGSETIKEVDPAREGHPSGVVRKYVEEALADLERRYDDIETVEGSRRNVERIKKEGALGEALDWATLGSVGGAALGRGLFRFAERTAKPGSRRERLTGPRPDLRVTGGREGTRPQERSRNLFRAAAEQMLDERRGRAQQVRTGERPPSVFRAPLSRERVRQQRAEGPRPALEADAGEVVPMTRVPFLTDRFGRAAREFAGDKARLNLQRQSRTRDELREIEREIGTLDRKERRAFNLALELGLATGRQGADQLRADYRPLMVANRELEAVNGTLRGHADELLGEPGGDIDTARELVEDELQGVLADRLEAAKAGEPDLRTDEGFDTLVAAVEERIPGAGALLEQDRKALVKRFDGMRSRRATNDALAAVDEILADPDAHLTERVIAAADFVRDRQSRPEGPEHYDPAVRDDTAEARRWRPLAMTMGEPDYDPDRETAEQFVERVRTSAKIGGYREPGYVEHVPRATVRQPFAVHAIGGTRSVAGTKPWTGSLFRTGRQNLDPKVVTHAVARNVKRYFNWNLVAISVDKHAFEWSRDKTPKQILDYIDEHRIDERDVAIWQPGRFYSAFADAEADELGGAERGVLPTRSAEDDAGDVTQTVEGAQMSVKQLRDELKSNPRSFTEAGRFAAIPRPVYEQIHATVKPDSGAARAYELVFKSLPSQAILGFFNVAWLQFQVASNALLYGLAVGPVKALSLPASAVQTYRWWRALDPKEREAIEPYIGVGHHHQDFERRHIGSQANNSFVRAFRAFQSTGLFRSIQDGTKVKGRKVLPPLNPVRLLFRLDEMQNNFWRRTLFVEQAKRKAFKDMSAAAGRSWSLQKRLLLEKELLTGNPRGALKGAVANRRLIEQHARKVNDFLGEYSKFTDAERRWLQRNVMFYGFLRFSLRFTFYTMPVQHPIMSTLLLQLGNLGREEVERLLGGNTLPWALGRYFYKKDGKTFSVNLARANPLLNQLTGMSGPNQFPGMFSPLISAGFNQVAEKDLFTGSPWKVLGESTTRPKEVGYDFESRARIFFNDMASTLQPYRMWADGWSKGPESDDSLPFDRRPIRYVDEDTVRRIRKGHGEREHEWQSVVLDLFPWIGQRDTTAAQAKRREERKREYEKSQRNRGKRRRSGSSGVKLDSGSGGGIKLGTGSSGGVNLGGD